MKEKIEGSKEGSSFQRSQTALLHLHPAHDQMSKIPYKSSLSFNVINFCSRFTLIETTLLYVEIEIKTQFC